MNPASTVLLVLHRLALDEPTRAMLTGLGVRIVISDTPTRTERLMRETSERVLVAFEVGSGGVGPEKLVASARAEGARVNLVPASTRLSGAVGSRAKRLGFDQAWVWPHGGLAELMRLLERHSEIRFRRMAPRGEVPPHLRHVELGDLHAQLINISATGALIETPGSGADLESLGFELAVGGETQLILARVVTRDRRGDVVRLGVQFTNVDARTREAIERFVQSVNVLRPKETHPALAPRERQTVRVRRGKRSDWFELDGTQGTGLLIPKKPFFVPYQVGDELVVEAQQAQGRRVSAMRVVGSMAIDQGIDSRIAWHVEPIQLAPAPAEDDVLVVRDLDRRRTVGDVRAAAVAGRIGDVIPVGTRFVLAARPDARAAEDSSPRPMQTRTLFLRRRGGEVETDLQPHMWFEPIPRGSVEIGRSRSCGLHFPVLSLSKVHARIFERDDGTLMIEDLGSSNGTRLMRVHDVAAAVTVTQGTPVELRDGDIILLGHYPLYLWDAARFERDILPAKTID